MATISKNYIWKKKLLGIVIIVFLILAAVIHFSNKDYYYRTLWYNLPGIFDEPIFYSRTVQKSDHALPWPEASAYNSIELSKQVLDSLSKYETVSVLFIQHDSVLVEKYWLGATDTTRSNSFSVAKSFVGALIGRAIQLGYIKSIDQPVGYFLKDFSEGEKRNITIRHLLTMSSGLDWNEAYSSLWSQTTEAYYGTEIEKQMLALSSKQKPGEYFEYQSCDTELLALILVKATGMPLATFFEKELWQPLGAVTSASWSLDHEEGMEKAYCCLYSNPKDFARLASLYLHNGNWNGKQLIDSTFVLQSVTPSKLMDIRTKEITDLYGFQWWLIPDYKGISVFYMRGILGQYIIAIPSLDMIVVRLGHKRGVKINNHYSETYTLIEEAIRLSKK